MCGRCASILPRCRRVAFQRSERFESPSAGSVSPMVTVKNHSFWYACQASVSPSNDSSIRGSPAAAEAASCSAVNEALRHGSSKALRRAVPQRAHDAYYLPVELGIHESQLREPLGGPPEYI